MPACNSRLKVINNKFCEIRSALIFNKLEFRQYLCERCKHSCTYHNVPLELIYKAETVLATDRQLGNFRKEFIKRNLNLSTIDGFAIEIGGRPGELAEDLRCECGHDKGIVVDFVSSASNSRQVWPKSIGPHAPVSVLYAYQSRASVGRSCCR